eukprot:5873011-Prymnesium_polylepis.1
MLDPLERDPSGHQLFKCDPRHCRTTRVVPPLLSLADRRNVYAWLGGRQLLLRFGDRFRARIMVYMG